MSRAGPTNGSARHGLVLLHGRGGSSADILGLLAHAALPQVAAIAPDAPGQSWWPTSFLAPSAQMEPFVQAALVTVAGAVATLDAEGLPRARIWLAGFSQGACLALEAMARAGQGLGGAFGLSGGLVGTADAPGPPEAALYGHAPKAFGYKAHLEGARIWLSVHAQDPHIPLRRVTESAAVFGTLGAKVESRVHPGQGHGILPADIAALRAALNT